MRSYVCSSGRYLKRNDVESRSLWRTCQSHLVFTIFCQCTTIVEIADIGIAIRLADIQIPCNQLTSIVEIHLIQVIYAQALAIHQHLIEVFHRCLWPIPHLCHGLNIVVILAKIIEEPITLITMPLVRIGIVVRIAEHTDTLVIHQFGITLVGLPLSRLLPCNATVSYRPMKARLHVSDIAMIGSFRIAHIMERVSDLMSHTMSYGLTSRGIQPQGRNHVIITTTITSPCFGMVHQHHHLVFVQVGVVRVNESQLIDFQIKERLTLLQQIVDVNVIETCGV